MQVNVLGSNGTYPTPGRPASGYVVTSGDTTVWLDAGPGTFAAALASGIPDRLDALVLTHRHADHCLDVLALLSYLRFGTGVRRPIRVLAPIGVVDGLAAFVGAGPDHDFFRCLAPMVVSPGDRVDVGGLVLTFGEAIHPVPAVCVAITDGHRMAVYSGDTGPGGDLASLAGGADMLLCEATLQGEPGQVRYPHHLFAAEAGRIAAAAGVGRLVVTHLAPTLEPEQSVAEAAEWFGPGGGCLAGIDHRPMSDHEPKGTTVRQGRRADELRPVAITRGFTEMTPGSVLIEMGRTRVLCTASFDSNVPRWMRERGSGWVTAEYNMLPGSSPERIDRRSVSGGRTKEIQRLIGRALRAVVDMEAMGEQMVRVDCDVLQADGGTRTAAITGAWVALHDAFTVGLTDGRVASNPITDHLAAVSVGIVGGELLLDLPYEEDAGAEVDLNVVMTGSGGIVEVQGTAEGSPFSREQLGTLLDLATGGIEQLVEAQRRVVAG